MKNLIKDEQGVAYLLLILMGVGIVAAGLTYGFMSDMLDKFLNIYDGSPLANNLDADAIYTKNIILTAFRFCLIFVLPVLIWFVYSMSQKPEKAW